MTVHTDPAHRRLMHLFRAQMRAAESPEAVRDLGDDDAFELAATLAQVARRAGWTPPANPSP